MTYGINNQPNFVNALLRIGQWYLIDIKLTIVSFCLLLKPVRLGATTNGVASTRFLSGMTIIISVNSWI